MLDQERRRVRELALRLDATGRSQGSAANGSDLDRPVQWRDGARRAPLHLSLKSGHQTKAPRQSGAP